MSYYSWLALILSVLTVGGGTALFRHASHDAGHRPTQQPRLIDGLPVVKLPAVTVHPSASDWRQAYPRAVCPCSLRRSTGRPTQSQAHNAEANTRKRRVSSSLRMPYYAFGAAPRAIGKD